MKLVAVQQESIVISRNQTCEFLMMDRVPVYLEVEAMGLPYPCKIVCKPSSKRYGYTEQQQNIIAEHMVIYISNKTKNPSARNH